MEWSRRRGNGGGSMDSECDGMRCVAMRLRLTGLRARVTRSRFESWWRVRSRIRRIFSKVRLSLLLLRTTISSSSSCWTLWLRSP